MDHFHYKGRVLHCEDVPVPVELIRSSRAGKSLQRVEAEAARVRIECREWRAAADVGDPPDLSRGQTPGHARDRRVGNAQQR